MATRSASLGNFVSSTNNYNDHICAATGTLGPLGPHALNKDALNSTLGKTTANDGEGPIHWLLCPGFVSLRWTCATGALFQPSSVGGGAQTMIVHIGKAIS